MAIAFVTIFLAALHNPKPHGLSIAVVGTEQVNSQVAQAFAKASPGSFDVRSYDTVEDAADALRSRDVYGVMDFTAGRTVHISYAGANGVGVTSAVEAALTATAAQLGHPATTTDAVPLPSGDSRGLSVFYFLFGLALSAFLFAMTLHQVAAGASLGVRLGFPLVFAAATGRGDRHHRRLRLRRVDRTLLGRRRHLGDDLLRRVDGHVRADPHTRRSRHRAGRRARHRHRQRDQRRRAQLALPARWMAMDQPTAAHRSRRHRTTQRSVLRRRPTISSPAHLAVWIAASLLSIIVLPLLRLDAIHRSHDGQHKHADTPSEPI
jgi:hypothetical protein